MGMESVVIEASYPITFRQEDAKKLGSLLKNRRSVVLIGMKRVGISSFLRFFLYHKGIRKTYIKEGGHFFIPVDLNDLVEREIFPFWILTFKRINDAVEKSDLPKRIKKQIELYFLDSIQTRDLFLTIDYIRKSINFLTAEGLKPTLFFLRFDRIIGAETAEFYANLQSLIDSSHRKLSFVITSARPLDILSPEIFNKHSLSQFSDNFYVKPGKNDDANTVLQINKKLRGVLISQDLEKSLINFVDGYSQYLQFALISLHETEENIKTKDDLEKLLINDERIALQSEELWESLTNAEKDLLIKVINQKKLSPRDKKESEYLLKTGFFDAETLKIFSPLFEYFVHVKETERKKESALVELSKKEFLLLKILEENLNEICEREQIIEAVWPEAEALGVTDWAIDRLIARLRGKLKNQNKKYEIITVKTRGYKLVN